nr:glycine cleavage system H protein 2, mitochondrial-like [Quercus suber]
MCLLTPEGERNRKKTGFFLLFFLGVQTLNFHSNMASGSLCSTEALLLDLKYLDSHEWVKVEGNSATVGVTDHAQDHLGDVVYIELPEVGAPISQGDSFGVVESVKATNDINSPISGKVVEVNKELNDSPGLVSTPSSVKKMIFTE